MDTIVHGECLEHLATLRDGSVDLIVTDPPYFLPAEHYKTRSKWSRSLSDLSIIEHFLRDVVTECRRVLSPRGAMFIFCDGQSYPAMYAVSYRIFDRLTDIVWDKQQIGMGRGFRRRHELILGCLPDGFRFRGWEPSVLCCKPVRKENRTHPAEKPIDLISSLILLASDRGSVVVDPFLGSGTTALAATQLGRHFVGIEREADYVRNAKARLDALNAHPLAAE